MGEVTAPSVTRIRELRECAGLSQEALGERVGVTRQTIAAWERGERDVGLAQLARVARALGAQLDDLFEDAPEDQPRLLFRADDPKALTPALRAVVDRKVGDYVAIESLLGEAPFVPESRPMEGFDPDEVEEVAERVRDSLGADDAPIDDVIELLESIGMKVVRHPLPNPVSGFSAFREDWGGVIVINASHPIDRQYFTALHELGHLIFHRREYSVPGSGTTNSKDPREKVANHFASAVLLPRRALLKDLRRLRLPWIPDPVLVDLRLKYKVSMRTIVLRAKTLGIIEGRQAGQQIGVLNKRCGRDREEPVLRAPQAGRRSRFEVLTFQALVGDLITGSRAAEVLGKPLREVREELKRYLTDPVSEAVEA